LDKEQREEFERDRAIAESLAEVKEEVEFIRTCNRVKKDLNLERKKTFQPEKPEPCVSCDNLGTRKAICGHYYCISCVKHICFTSLTDRQLVPARCCKQEFPQEWVHDALTADEYARYREYQLDIEAINGNEIDPTYREMIFSFGWQPCPRCGVGIEKTQDCGHMTCLICRFEFCYRCGANWKPRDCSCDLFSPEEIEAIVHDREPRARPEVLERLRHVYRNHDAHVHRWEKNWVEDRRMKKCVSCNWICNMWYWRCEACQTNSCGTCAFNRRF
jgi:hypothetical protein